ncbi:MAG TPA: HAMP domain-containing sensor histidine kinase [Solirubrobacteraceae bacterium]|jgi:two-component system sensor histidine kinase MprB|nr:HAMP domain-containing sensor histidine kinase [Solirubrobacteraceae bacterium]
MSFRRRMVLLAAGAVATAIVLASAVVYVVTRGELLSQIDSTLRAKLAPGQSQSVQIRTVKLSESELAKLKREGRLPLQTVTQLGIASSSPRLQALGQFAGGGATPASRHLRGEAVPTHGTAVRVSGGGVSVSGSLPSAGEMARLVLPQQKLGGAPGYVQLIQSDGRVLRSESKGTLLPVTPAARAVAAGRRQAFFSNAKVAGTPVRELTERAPEDGVWQVALPLSDLNSTLSHLQLVLAVVSLGGIALAALLGLLVSRAALVPVRRLTGAAERVAHTQDLGHRIPAAEGDELGRLAASFNSMLAALERSRLAQRQLVSDASHELRTPLTSVQANLDALAIGERLAPSERARIIAVVQAQLSELTVLVGDLVDLSKTDVEEVEIEDVRLDLATAAALERARLHAPRCSFTLDAEPCLIRCAPGRLDRAIANLLDNACQWTASPHARPIEVRVRDGTLRVRDHGPGIAEEDLPRVFDRFYRAPVARARPGSGLGLAIVRHLAETHGGTVRAANAHGGGALLTLELPVLEMTAAELEACVASRVLHQAPRML